MFRCPLISLKYTAVMAVLISTPAASQQQQPQQAPKPSLQWEQLPLMQLEQMYRGPRRKSRPYIALTRLAEPE
jgi:hypothetical protein